MSLAQGARGMDLEARRNAFKFAQGKFPPLLAHTLSPDELDRLRRLEQDKGADPDLFEDQERGLWGMSEKVNYDSGGRIVLHQLLRDEARIEDLALFVGRGRFVEMWNPKVAIEIGGDKLKKIAAFYLKQRGGN